MNRILTSVIMTTAAILSYPALANAQEDYRFDAGGGPGIAGYLGDANSSNVWKNPSWNMEILFRYIANPRWAFKTGLYIGGLSGDSGKTDNIFPDDNTHRFTTNFYELGELAEFNFFNYGMGETYRKLKRISPYITAGAAVTMWKTAGNTGASFTIPFGVGVKYKPSRKVNLGLEFLMKKTFSDRLDGAALDDPMGIASSAIKNTDWYSTLTFTVSYEFSKRCAVCNYKD